MNIFVKRTSLTTSIFLLALILNIPCTFADVNDGSRYATKSKLSSGKWVKLKVTENAIYKLTYEDIQKMGLNPEKTKLYGYGGWILDEDFTKTYTDDLPLVSVWMSGSDIKLDPGEFMLFYGRGTVKWAYNTSTKEFEHENNPYATYGTYFLGETEDELKLMKNAETIANATTTVSSFRDYLLHEKNEYSIAKMGRELYGENFTSRNQQTFDFKTPGITSDAALVRLSFAANTDKVATLTLSVNNNANNMVNVIETPVAITTGTYVKATGINKSGSWTGEKNENTKVVVNYSDIPKFAYLDFIRINITRQLKYYNTGYTFFRNNENLTKNIRYNIGNATSDLLVFDITENYNTKIVPTELIDNTLTFSAASGTLREYALVDPVQEFATPEKIEDITLQNLHGIEQIDMAIISPKVFVSEAERLAQAHRTRSGLKVQVVTTNQIYNEFSSGTYDATAYRRFMKMFFDRAQSEDEKPKYLLLFGDGIFDNRFQDPTCSSLDRENFILTYSSSESLITEYSYCTDDYFGFLDENEEKEKGINKPIAAKNQELGIGRIPAQSLSTAKIAVNKIISYMDNKNKGIWKNSVVFMADDTDTNAANQSFTMHKNQADSVAHSVLQKDFPEYMVSKIYLDAFKPDNPAGARTFNNTAKKKLHNALEDGCLLFNYTGHGNSTRFSDNMMDIPDIQQLKSEKLPLWITASCEFSKFDAITNSGGELVFFNENGGGIALYSATRTAYAQDNMKLNLALTRNLFTKKDGKYPTLGDVIRKSKNSLVNNENKLNFILLGDPALTLNYPEYSIELDKINGEAIDKNKTYTFKSLDNVTISGFIKNENGTIDESFNGSIAANIFDGIQIIKTISVNTAGKYSYFTDYPSLIFPANSTVENGRFVFSFPIMKDIAGTVNPGKINMYASDKTSGKEANNSYMNYNLFGTNENADFNDTSSPVISNIYLDNPEFKSGDTVNETPYFFVSLTDKYGINISGSGIGHDIEIIIDKMPAKTYNLNNFYKINAEDNSGYIGYNIPELEDGNHTLTFRAWNILNNSTIHTLNFNVKREIPLEDYSLTATTNPVKTGNVTSFLLTHNEPETQMEIMISIYDLSGRQVWGYTKSGSSELLSADEILCDLKYTNGNFFQPGIYIYNATIKTENGTQTTKTKKMIVEGQ